MNWLLRKLIAVQLGTPLWVIIRIRLSLQIATSLASSLALPQGVYVPGIDTSFFGQGLGFVHMWATDAVTYHTAKLRQAMFQCIFCLHLSDSTIEVNGNYHQNVCFLLPDQKNTHRMMQIAVGYMCTLQ